MLECARCGDPVAYGWYRGCDLCGWVMHDGCWHEALAFGELHSGDHCPIEVESVSRWELVEVDGFTPTGRPKRRRQLVMREYRDSPEGHGNVLGQLWA
jgi:hypothetical protein